MRFLSLSGLMAITISSAVNAADIPVAQFGTVKELRLERAKWSGFSGVLFAGGAFLGADGTLTASNYTEDENNFQRAGNFGGSIGYDRQFRSFILGAHLEGMLTNFRSGPSRPLSVEAKWLNSGTARLGFDAGRFMPYFSVGVGYGRFSVQNEQTYYVDAAPSVFEVSTSNTTNAYALVLGGGLEARIQDGLFLRADYKHFRFQDVEFELNEPEYVRPVSFTASNKIDVFNLGLGYRF